MSSKKEKLFKKKLELLLEEQNKYPTLDLSNSKKKKTLLDPGDITNNLKILANILINSVEGENLKKSQAYFDTHISQIPFNEELTSKLTTLALGENYKETEISLKDTINDFIKERTAGNKIASASSAS